MGSSGMEESGDIKIKAPDIAENGSVVPVTISTGLSNVESITILAESNGTPLVGSFDLSGAEAYVSTRIKMAKTGNVIAVVKSGGKMYSGKKEVKVTIGGCGG
jgi:sulfur-oxidizing protein SoxY